MKALLTYNISKDEYSVACMLYNKSIIEQDNNPIKIEDIRVVNGGSKGATDFIDETLRITR